MALEKCRECGKEVSSEARSCPHCGALPLKKCRECGKEVSVKAEKCPHCGVECPTSDLAMFLSGTGKGIRDITSSPIFFILIVLATVIVLWLHGYFD